MFDKILGKINLWYSPKNSKPKEQCPCCDYITLAERNEYLICPICMWEDDGVEVDNLDKESGANHMTLRQGRKNFQKFGACSEKMIPFVLSKKERKKFKYKKRDL